MSLAVARNKVEEVRGTCIELKKAGSLTMAQADDLAGEGSFVCLFSFFFFFLYSFDLLRVQLLMVAAARERRG